MFKNLPTKPPQNFFLITSVMIRAESILICINFLHFKIFVIVTGYVISSILKGGGQDLSWFMISEILDHRHLTWLPMAYIHMVHHSRCIFRGKAIYFLMMGRWMGKAWSIGILIFTSWKGMNLRPRCDLFKFIISQYHRLAIESLTNESSTDTSVFVTLLTFVTKL